MKLLLAQTALILMRIYVAVRAQAHVAMYHAGFVPRGLHIAMIGKCASAEAHAAHLDHALREHQGWRTIAEMRRAVLERHNLYTTQLAALEIAHTGIGRPEPPPGSTSA